MWIISSQSCRYRPQLLAILIGELVIDLPHRDGILSVGVVTPWVPQTPLDLKDSGLTGFLFLFFEHLFENPLRLLCGRASVSSGLLRLIGVSLGLLHFLGDISYRYSLLS